jgi:tRNA pseudouridine32 synthase/23S rRNA pseudouridine746 synthase
MAPLAAPIDVLYQDAHLLAANKPPGLLSVPGRGPENQDCLINRLLDSFPDCRTVHRLDMATSGIVLLARNLDSLRALSRQFEQRKVEKEYVAVTEGVLANDEGEVSLPLICDWPNRPRQKVCHNEGKTALTRYKVMQRDAVSNCTRVLLMPVTGRSHQLRVHMMAMGHSILGDEFYAQGDARSASSRLLLHASRIRFTHPITGDAITLESAPEF